MHAHVLIGWLNKEERRAQSQHGLMTKVVQIDRFRLEDMVWAVVSPHLWVSSASRQPPWWGVWDSRTRLSSPPPIPPLPFTSSSLFLCILSSHTAWSYPNERIFHPHNDPAMCECGVVLLLLCVWLSVRFNINADCVLVGSWGVATYSRPTPFAHSSRSPSAHFCHPFLCHRKLVVCARHVY